MAAAASGGERKRWEDALPRGQRTRALCIGASDYTKMDRLANAIADADGIAQCIDDLPDSSAYAVQNPANKRLLKKAIEDFLVAIPRERPPRIVLIFYAGHAIQDGDKIFLVPVNADPKTPGDLKNMCLSHDDLFRMLKFYVDDEIEVENVLYVVILDACRKALGGTNVQTQFSPEIHEPLPEKRPYHWVLCTSTSRGAVAADGEGGHSPFTEALMSAECGMFRQDVPLNWALKMVCQKLREQGGQEPCFMPPGNIPDSLCLCESDQRRADDENFDVCLCYRDEGEDRALAERLRDKLTSTYAEQRGLEKRPLRVFLEAGPPPPDRIVQIADAMHNSAVILLLISHSTFDGVDTLSDARGSPLHQMLWQYEVALELLECGTHHSKHRRFVPLLIGRRGAQSGHPKFEDINEIADHGEFWPISKMPDFQVRSIKEDALFALRRDAQVANGLEAKMMRCARDTPSILRGRSIRQTVSAFSARDIFKVWTLQGREDHALGDICRRLKDVLTFDQMLLKLITAVTTNARKKDVVDILTEAREQGINGKDLINGLFKRDVPEGRTPLAYAAKMNLLAMADHLLDLGASVNQRMDDNMTALSLAATNDRWDGTEMVRLLLSKRADPSVLATAGVDVKQLNITMQYWLDLSQKSPPISDEDVADLERTAPMHKMHELTYAIVGERLSLSMFKNALSGWFSKPRGFKDGKLTRDPLVMLLLGCPGHGKTYISRNAARSLVGKDNYTEVACGAIRDDADLFGSNLGGGGGQNPTMASKGKLIEWLRARQGLDTIVFLDEFEKIKGLTSALGWDQSKKIYMSFLEVWQEGYLSDTSSVAGPKVDCSRVVWILTSNWGQEEIVAFANKNPQITQKVNEDDLAWIKRELIDKILTPEVIKQFKGVHSEVQALARRINYTIPFLPFTEDEREVVADMEIRRRFQQWRTPAVLQGPEEDRKLYGNLHLAHTPDFLAYVVSHYVAMEGASSMARVVQCVNGDFALGLSEGKFRLSELQHKRIKSEKPPPPPRDPAHVPEPKFWAHYDHDVCSTKITMIEPQSSPEILIKSLIDKHGGKELLMSRAFIIGQGRVGKTCLYRGMVGELYRDEKSTVGADEGIFEVSDAHVEAQEQWSKFEPDKHPGYYAEAMARAAADARQGKAASSADGIESYLTAQKADSVKMAANDSNIPRDQIAAPASGNESKKEVDKEMSNAATTGRETGAEKDILKPVATEQWVMDEMVQRGKEEEKNVEELPVKPLDEDLVIKYMRESTLGLQWEEVGPNKPTTGTEIENAALGEALQTRNHFSMEDLQTFKEINSFDLSYTSFIKVGSTYFKPVATSEAIKLSVWDFGGQERFYLLHLLFLSSLGVYLICFNMCHILGEEKEKQEALKFLRFWLQTASIHALGRDEKSAPVLLVGTHKDKVPREDDHRKISSILTEEFQYCDVWTRETLARNGRLCFFPVNNVLGQQDDVVRALMNRVCKLVKEQEHMKRKVPLTWLALFDEFVSEKKRATTLPLKDAEERARRCGLGRRSKKGYSSKSHLLTLKEEVQLFLKYFTGLGFIMYSDEPNLHHLIVLDPIKFLIPPATRIVCDFQDIHSLHRREEHETAKRRNPEEWGHLEKRAILTRKLIPDLWEGVAEKERQDHVENILVKYSILVPLIRKYSDIDAESANGPECRYLVPGILPMTSSADLHHECSNVALLVVASMDKIREWTDSSKPSKHCIDASRIKKQGFLPMGIFPRLLSKIVTQIQRVDGLDIQDAAMNLSEHCAELEMECCKFSFSLDFEYGCIRVGFGEFPNYLVLSKLKELADEVLRENKGNLDCAFAMQVPKDKSLLTWWKVFEKVVADSSELRVNGINISPGEVQQDYGQWLLSSGPAEDGSYDVFLSHRHIAFDAKFADDIFCRIMSCHRSKARHLFLDKHCIRRGKDYRSEICKALIKTRVAVPIISHAALTKMSERVRNNEPDTLLFEWILILELCALGKISHCVPLTFGKISAQGEEFEVSALQALSDLSSFDESLVCTKENEAVREKLQYHGITPRLNRADWTLGRVVQEMLNRDGFDCARRSSHKYTPVPHRELLLQRDMIQECTRQIVNTVKEARSEQSHGDKRARSPSAQTRDEAMQKQAKLCDGQAAATCVGAHSGTKRPREDLSELQDRFNEYGLGPQCSQICEKLGVDCIDDLAEVEPGDVKKLGLQPVREKKLLKMIGPSGAVAGGGGGVGSGGGGSCVRAPVRPVQDYGMMDARGTPSQQAARASATSAPHTDLVMQLVPSQAAHKVQEALGGPAGDASAQSAASQGGRVDFSMTTIRRSLSDGIAIEVDFYSEEQRRRFEADFRAYEVLSDQSIYKQAKEFADPFGPVMHISVGENELMNEVGLTFEIPITGSMNPNSLVLCKRSDAEGAAWHVVENGSIRRQLIEGKLVLQIRTQTFSYWFFTLRLGNWSLSLETGRIGVADKQPSEAAGTPSLADGNSAGSISSSIPALATEIARMDPELVALFSSKGLGSAICEKVCSEFGITCSKDLAHVQGTDVSTLGLKLVDSRKLEELVRELRTSAQPAASPGRLPVIEGFFCRKIPDKKQLLRELEAVKHADAEDRDERLTQLEAQLMDLEAIDVHKEAQVLTSSLSGGRRVFEMHTHPQPSFDAFASSMRSARERNVRLLHLAGHGGSRCGFFWLKNQAVSTEYEEVSLDAIVKILRTEVACAGGTIECVVLNACETEDMGKGLRLAGVPHVVCWRSEVQDDTAITFALHFYASLNDQDSTRALDYQRAFQQAVARMASGGGAARAPQKHLAAGAVDYVCLLSEHGNEFPDTGHIRRGEEESDSRQF